MEIRTELSEVGRSVVQTVIDRGVLEGVTGFLIDSPKTQEWCYPEMDMPTTGVKLAFWHDPGDDEVKLIWRPGLMLEALRSQSLLMSYRPLGLSTCDHSKTSEVALEVYPVCGQDFRVWANFSPRAWDLIESQEFLECLPAINRELQLWWEDQVGVSKAGYQMVNVFEGRTGTNLMVYQPVGSGLWISGNRDQNPQVVDHNTATTQEAFAHVLSLCLVLKSLREMMA